MHVQHPRFYFNDIRYWCHRERKKKFKMRKLNTCQLKSSLKIFAYENNWS